MPHINLLPWREELRKQRQKDFYTTTGIAALLMGVVILGVHIVFNDRIEHQNTRNQYLEDQIAKLDEGIKEIKDLEEKKRRLLARMQIIQQLQASRPEIVRVFDEIVATLPEGVYYKKLRQKGRSLTFEGVAQSNARVSSLMRNLDRSPWLEDPELIQIRAIKKDTGPDFLRLSDFSMSIRQPKPKAPEAAQVAEAGGTS